MDDPLTTHNLQTHKKQSSKPTQKNSSKLDKHQTYHKGKRQAIHHSQDAEWIDRQLINKPNPNLAACHQLPTCTQVSYYTGLYEFMWSVSLNSFHDIFVDMS
jgi:hypothetical protein